MTSGETLCNSMPVRLSALVVNQDMPHSLKFTLTSTELGDFPFEHPTTDLEAHANKLVRDGAESIEFCEQVEPIIDWADTHELRQEDPNAAK